MKKCRFKKFLIFIFSVFCVGFTSVGVYAQGNVTTEANLQARLWLQAKLLDKKLKKEDFEKIKNYRDYLLKNFKESTSYDHETDGKSEQLDFKNFEEEADRLFVAIYNFVNKTNAEGITAENFNDYVKKFMEESGGSMTCLSRQDFDIRCNSNAGMKKFYRGITKIEYVKQFRDGVAYIGGTIRGKCFDDKHGSSYGHCVYTSANKLDAEGYAKSSKQQKNDKTGLNWMGPSEVGGVIEMAIDTDEIKYIHIDHLCNVVKALLYYYPLIGNAYEYFDQCFCDWEVDSFDENEYHKRIAAKVFEDVFGFEQAKLVSIINPNYKNLDEKEKERFRNKICSLRSDLKRFPNYASKVNELFSADKVKPHYVDKYCAVLNDEGLLAKLMGKDAIFTMTDKDGNINFDEGYCLIVNPGVIIVCNDDSEDLGLTSGMEPTVENLQELFDKFYN